MHAIESLAYDSNTAIESLTSQVETIAAKIEIGALVQKLSDFLCDKIKKFNQTTKADGCDHAEMLETTKQSPHIRME